MATSRFQDQGFSDQGFLDRTHPPIDPLDPLGPLGPLDPAGPLHINHSTAHWPVCDPIDAIDALDLCRPGDFAHGVLVMFLDADRYPRVTLAVRDAPTHGPGELVPFLLEACATGQVSEIVFGVVFRSDATTPIENGDMQMFHTRWALAASSLKVAGIETLDLLTSVSTDDVRASSPPDWSSMVLRCGSDFYPERTVGGSRWYERSPNPGSVGRLR